MSWAISPTQLGLFAKCGEAWRRRYVEGERIPPGIAACVGRGVHAAAEAALRHKMADAAPLALDQILDAARDGYSTALANGIYAESVDAARQGAIQGVDRVINMTRTLAKEVLPGIHPAAVETRLEARHPDLPVPFLGILDIWDRRAEIVDLKTTRRAWTSAKAATGFQPGIYSFLVSQTWGVTPGFRYEVISDGGKHQTFAASTGIKSALVWARALLRAAETGDVLPAEPGHWMCSPRWCGYYLTCKLREGA